MPTKCILIALVGPGLWLLVVNVKIRCGPGTKGVEDRNKDRNKTHHNHECNMQGTVDKCNWKYNVPHPSRLVYIEFFLHLGIHSIPYHSMAANLL